MGGIRAEITIDDPSGCPVTRVSDIIDAKGSSIRKSVPADPDKEITEEFVVDTDESIESVEMDAVDTELSEVFSYGEEHVYRFNRPQQPPCLCDSIELFDLPVRNVSARDGTLTVSFHAPDIETLQNVIQSLNESWTNVSIHRLLRSNGSRDDDELILVDRSELTNRQREVLTTAHEMGYFDHPKGSNAGEIAAELDINTSTFVEHLAAAQRKLLSTILQYP